MDLQEAVIDAYLLMKKHGLIERGWKIALNNRMSALGLCSFKKRTIFLSRPYIEANEWSEVKDTVLHELAHFFSPPYYDTVSNRIVSHHYEWKKKCIELGARPERCAVRAKRPEAKYISICPTCGKKWWVNRKGKNFNFYICTCKTPLIFVENKNACHSANNC